ncbi:MAG: cache domain-containing protein, partial [Deltaproteobacteria bacterium]|nr:cache domain-containing protein [Deltaproteobacteria bacterium]
MLDFQKKFFLGVGVGVLLLLVAGLVLGFYSLSTMREVVTDQFNKQQLVLAEQASRQIETDLKIIFQELAVLNQSPTVQYLEPISWANRVQVTLDVVRELGVVEIGRVSRDGSAAFSVTRDRQVRLNREAVGPLKEAFLWASDPGQRGKIKITKDLAVPGVAGNHPIIGLSLPTYLEATNLAHPSAKQDFAGTLFGVVDLEQLVARVVKNIRSGRTGYAWVIDQEGRFLFHPLPEFIGQNAFTVREQKGALVSFDQINRLQKDQMLRGEQGTSWYFSGWHGSEKGKIKKLIAYSPLRLEIGGDRLRGSVAVAAPVSEVDEAIHAVYIRQFLMQGVIIFAILLGGVLLLSFSWQYARTLQKEVTEKTRDWRESEERYRKLVENAQDLIFSVDREGKLLSLNRFGVQFLDGQLFQLNFSGPGKGREAEPTAVEYQGQSIFNYFNPEEPFDPRTLAQIWDSGRPKALEHPVRIGPQECWLSTQL